MMSLIVHKKVHALGLLASAMLVAVSALSTQTYAQEQSPAEAAIEQVNINAADAKTIADVLVGVGDSKAKAIVEFREQNGPFTSVDELTEVNGIGEATLSQNRERITLE
jgi:competence protein ComEA